MFASINNYHSSGWNFIPVFYRNKIKIFISSVSFLLPKKTEHNIKQPLGKKYEQNLKLISLIYCLLFWKSKLSTHRKTWKLLNETESVVTHGIVKVRISYPSLLTFPLSADQDRLTSLSSALWWIFWSLLCTSCSIKAFILQDIDKFFKK